MSRLSWLHLSDWHQEGKDFDREVVRDALLRDIEKRVSIAPELEKIEFIVFSGDVAQDAKEEEYNTTIEQLFTPLLNLTGLPQERLFIIPGNHDIDRKKFKFLPADIAVPLQKKEDVVEWLTDKEGRAAMVKPFTSFSEFTSEYTGQIGPAYANSKIFTTDTGISICLAGLNSALMCGRNKVGYKVDDRNHLIIGEPQVRDALAKIGNENIRIAVLHHPFDFLAEFDRTTVEADIKRQFHFILHGHTHKPEVHRITGTMGDFVIIPAGACYNRRLQEEPNYISSYNFVSIDLEEGMGRVFLRRWDETQKEWWKLDAKTSPDGIVRFTLPKELIQDESTPIKILQKNDIAIPFLENFLAYHLAANRHLSMQGFESTLRVPIELERVYICMRANIGGYKNDAPDGCEGIFSKIGKHLIGRQPRNDSINSCSDRDVGFVDIKQAFDSLRKLHVKDMIILGDPGSGKTTLLKYILVMLIEEKGEELLGIEPALVPFFLPLRDLRRDDLDAPFEEFMLRVCKCTDFGITVDRVKAILEDGCGIVLLDGLDEVADEQMRIATCRWIDRARGFYQSTRFIISSRFAGYMGKVKLEELPVLELSIQDFSSSEIAVFLTRWYETVRLALNPGGDEEMIKRNAAEEAKGLIEDVEASGHIRRFAVNPLLLQIIALVRFDRGTAAKLPDRRIELYQECTDVLLARWDMAKGLKVLLTAQQARKILQPIALHLHGKDGRRSAPFREIENEIRKSLDSIGCSDITPEALLRNIRDRSGIFMGYGTEEYGFTHLSFQEYLAAEQIRNTHKINLLVEKYGSEWWREVTLLALGLDNPSIIDEFMEVIIKRGLLGKDIQIINDSIRDSITKPAAVFAAALKNDRLSMEERQNAISIVELIGGATAVEVLREAAGSNDRTLALAAYTALVRMHAADGVAKVAEEKPSRLLCEKDGSELLLVPAGTFLYGSRIDDKVARNNEKPQQSLYLPDYYIGKYPVTNQQYKRFVDATGYRSPDKADFGKPVWKGNGFRQEYGDHPVVCVSWEDAMAYAEWACLGLPSEVQWEKAARGVDGRVYPWGDDWVKDRCNSFESGVRKITPVTTYDDGISPFGIHNMAGNVWEWCKDLYSDNNQRDPDDPVTGPDLGSNRVLRGGSWAGDSRLCRCAYRFWRVPGFRNVDVGFRVVSSRS